MNTSQIEAFGPDIDDIVPPREPTPGPWRAHEPIAVANKQHTYWVIAAGDEHFDENGHGFRMSGFISPPNAKILGAAWDMREALNEILELFDGQEDIKDAPGGGQIPNDAMKACAIVRAALAKAEPA